MGIEHDLSLIVGMNGSILSIFHRGFSKILCFDHPVVYEERQRAQR